MTTTPLESITIYRNYLIEIRWSEYTEGYFWTIYKGSEEWGDNSKD